MSSDLTVEKFSEIVGTLYDAALDPTQWRPFSRHITEVTDSVLCAVGVTDARTMHLDILSEYGLYPAYSNYLELYVQALPINPMAAYGALCDTGDIVVHSEVAPEDPAMPSLFYRSFVEPMGLRDAMAVVCLRTGSRIIWLAANRSARQDIYGPADARILRLLSPHLCRAAAIAELFQHRAVDAKALEATIDGLLTGVFLVDPSGRVVHANPAAERMVTDGRVIKVVGGKLAPVNKDSREELLASLARPQTLATPAHGALVLLGPGDTRPKGLIATLLPLHHDGSAVRQRADGARWAVFVQDPQTAIPLPGEAFAKLYKLTPAEFRVALALAPGHPPEEAAGILGLALPTVRSHLQRIYSKTGVTRQADLVRLMMSASPPV
jgi:DNA-binding CsgD family transcriptional regulator